VIKLNLPIRTKNPLNGAQGMTPAFAMKRARERKEQREITYYVWLEKVRRRPELPVVVTLTRIAPRKLDNHDGLAPSMKGIVDQLAVQLGLPTNKKGHARDDDPRVTWKYDQRKGGVREYAVEVHIERRPE
jgi:hypothetical protein